jgi:hypothetical protein
MPVSGSPPHDQDATSTVLGLFRQVHDQIRAQVDGLDDGGLDWVPIVGTNSIAVIVTHLVGSEAETLRCVAGIASERDRKAEFSHPVEGMAAVLAILDEADRFLTQVQPLINEARLESAMSLPTLATDDRRLGLTWLVGNYGHACEHVGQIQMTKQLYLGRA